MSNRSAVTRTGGGARPSLPRVPMFVPPLLMVFAGVIGLLFAIPNGTINQPYFIVFALAAVLGTIMVVPRGLVVTVAQIPILFAIITFFTAWFTGTFADPENGGATAATSRRARLVTSAYPIVQQFPWLVVIMLICVIIAVWRYLEITRLQQKSRNQQAREAKRRQDLDDARVESSSQVRRRLAESERRGASRGQDTGASRRPAADIIRDAEARRIARQQEMLARQDRERPAGRAARPAASARSGQPSKLSQATRSQTSRPAQPSRAAQPTRSTQSPSQSRRSIDRPNRPIRPAQESIRRQAGSSARMWGEQPSTSAGAAGTAGSADRYRRTEEWPPRQQRPRQERISDRDHNRDRDRNCGRARYRDDSRRGYRN